jgi:hypothetical protein
VLAIADAQRWLKKKRPSLAIDRLKSARAQHPADESLAVALAHAYTQDDNAFWALNVLGGYIEQHPPACNARAWAAWIHLGQANLDQAESLLGTHKCTSPPEARARLLLLRALVEEQRDRADRVVELLSQARSEGRFYSEDHELLEALTRRYDATRLPWMSWNLDLSGGWTSNGLAGVPVDTTSAEQSGSVVVLVGAGLRIVLPTTAVLAPVADVQVRAQQLTSSRANDFSYRQLRLRPGVRAADFLGLEVKYGFEALHLQGGDVYSSGPLWYSEAHRAEYEIQPSSKIMLFGGAGWRTVRERVRSRAEFDQGIVYDLAVTSGTGLLLGLSARWHAARVEAYSLFGSTALAQVDVALGHHVKLKQGVSLSADIYPHSEGYFPSAGNQDRYEILPRATTGIVWPTGSALQGTLEYSYTRRDSTASAYSYTDHRALARLRWSLDSDQLGTTLVPRGRRIPLETRRGSGEAESRHAAVRELMHQDEAAQRSSSCLK